jgi:hypothetical protein
VSHHADDTKLYLRDLASDGPAALECIDQYRAASGAIMSQEKNTGVCMGSHVPVHGVDPATQAAFAMPGAPPVVSLGVPCTTDAQAAAAVVYPRRLASIRSLHFLWRRFPLSMVGRTLNAKQLMGNTICYHASFVPPPAADLKAMGDAIINHVASSSLSEDRTIKAGGGRLQLLPKRAVACLPYCMGGLSVPDLPNQVVSLQAKVLASAFSPGPHAWKALMQHALAEAAPVPAMGPVWALLPSLPVPAGLSAFLAAYVTAMRACRPSLVYSNFDVLPLRALLLLPVASLHALIPGLPALPLQPPEGWPYLLGQLATCPPDLRASPALAALAASMPDRLKEAVAVAEAGDAALRLHDTWWQSAGGTLAAFAASPVGPFRLFSVSAAGLLALPPADAAFDHATAVPACVLDVPKPRHMWTDDERAAHSAARPHERAATRPTHRCLLGAWRDVLVYPDSWSVAGIRLHQYSAADTRADLTAHAATAHVAARAPDYVPGKPLRPRLWPRPGAPLASGLADTEAAWASFHAASARRAAAAAAAAAAPAQTLLLWQRPRPPGYCRPASIRRAAAAAAADAAAARDAARGGAAGTSAAPSPPPPPPAPVPPPTRSPSPPPPLSPRPSPPHSRSPSPPRSRSPSPPRSRSGSPPAAAPPPVGRPSYPWYHLWHLPISNRAKVFGHRLLHGSIPCRAMVAGMRAQPAPFLACPACDRGRAAGAAAAPAETYTHLFLDCPVYRPALQWLSSLWAALPSSTAPPLEASVFITAEPGAPWQPAQARARVWHSLRLLTLHAIWDARVSGEAHRQTAAAVVASVVASVTAEITLQHARCTRREHHARQLPVGILAMRRLQAASDDYSAWAAAGLCQVLDAGSPSGGHLVVLLTSSWPVQAPV